MSLNKEMRSGELIPGLNWLQLKGLVQNVGTPGYSPTYDGVLLWSKELGNLRFALGFIGNQGIVYMEKETMPKFVREYPDLAASALSPNTWVVVKPYNLARVILEQLGEEQTREISEGYKRGGFALINKSLITLVEWSRLPNNEKGGH